MKIIIALVIFSIIIMVILFSRFGGGEPLIVENGQLHDMENKVQRLLSSTKEDNFLIITNPATSDFFQMQAYNEGLQIDFPLVTERQKNFEMKIKEASAKKRLTIQENFGSDGSKFLDIDIEREPSRISEVAVFLMKEIFSVTDTTELKFEFNI